MNSTNAANRRREVALKNLKARKDPNKDEVKTLEERIKNKDKYRKYLRRAPSTARVVADSISSTPA